MEYYIVQKVTRPYVNGGFWYIDVIVSSSKTGDLYKDKLSGRTRRQLLQIKKGDIYTPNPGKDMEKVNSK